MRNVGELDVFEGFVLQDTELKREEMEEAIDSLYYENENLEKSKQAIMEVLPLSEDSMENNEKALEAESTKLEVHQQKINENLEDINEILRLRTEMNTQMASVLYEIARMRPSLPQLINEQDADNDDDQQQGLSSARIQQFHQFTADQSLVGDRCGVCLDDIEVGKRMMRLDCNGQHVFCQGCVEGWFCDRNTCPSCRHVF